jgi:hypothetical protein
MSAILFFAHLIQVVLNARDSLRIAIQVVTALEIELDNKLNYLLALYTHIQDMEARMKSAVEATSVVTINMRGTLFVIETEHLTASSNIFFYILIYNSDPTSIRHYFIDRPFEGFDLIVNAMRGEELSYEGLNDYEAHCIEANLNYFRLLYPRYTRNFQAAYIWTTEAESVSYLYSLLCIGLMNGILQVWNTSTYQCEIELLGHTDSVKCILQLNNGRLCSSSRDNTIKFWNLLLCVCEATIVCHHSSALVQYSSTQLCSCSWENKIQLWNIDSGVCEKIISTDKFQIFLQRLLNGTIASLGCAWTVDTIDLTISMWDIHTSTCILTIELGKGKHFPSGILQLSSSDLCICTNSGICIYNYQTGVKMKTIALPSGTNALYAAMILHNQRLFISINKTDSQNNYNLLLGLNVESEEYEQVIEVEAPHSHITQLRDGRLMEWK